MTDAIHKNLAAGRWFELTLAEQLGNIGSEYNRATMALKMGDAKRYESAAERTLELCELTRSDTRWLGRPAMKELGRMKSLVAKSLYEDRQTMASLQNYFDQFAMMARIRR